MLRATRHLRTIRCIPRYYSKNDPPVIEVVDVTPRIKVDDIVGSLKEINFSVDKSRLVQKTYEKDENIPEGKEEENGLTKHLKQRIKAAGPISMSTFMNEALVNSEHGYYRTGTDTQIFGRSGDFVTSPDVSKMFGEMITIWLTTILSKLDQKKPIHLVELGPGKGTLMKDILDVLHRVELTPDFLNVHLVEVSTGLREVQNEVLGSPVTKTEFGRVPIYWHDDLSTLPTDDSVVFLAHEFFDALPVFQFEKTERGWSEVLVDVDQSAEVPQHFHQVLAPGQSVPAKLLENQLSRFKQEVGTRAELAVYSLAFIQQISQIISERSGACLIVDYGTHEKSGFTCRGIYKHEFVNIFEKPGQVDLSVDVDWKEITNAVEDYSNGALMTAGPQSQKGFLTLLGIDSRCSSLLRRETSDEKCAKLLMSYERLVEQMGESYQALCIVPKNMFVVTKEIPGFELEQ
ncbi:hypothetical protein AKO1_007694 [Acrasis kona]|uniref:Protein arginine methyltransferase NDUFAF7 n=1 Tax=Acrasis kona TaxID=1008807 RepID=A0AAW2YQT8_9EUKA